MRRGMVTKQITAKADLSSYYNKEFHEWIGGNSYTATFENGEITLDAEQGKKIFNGVQKDQVYENFIFWR